MKHETLTIRLPEGGTAALTAAGTPHGMTAREYARWRLLRALAEDLQPAAAAFLGGEPPADAAGAPQPESPALGPRPVDAGAGAPQRPERCTPHQWETPVIGDRVIRCSLCNAERSLVRLQARHVAGMERVAKRNGRPDFAAALRASLDAVRAADGKAPLDYL